MEKHKTSGFRTSIGGQALIEGILMRGPEKQAIVVRSPDGLVVKEEDLKLIRDRYPILGWPLIRGSVTFLDSMVRGVKALMYSADFYPEETPEEPSRFEQWLDRKLGNKKMEKLIIGFSVVLAVCFSLLLFMLMLLMLLLFLLLLVLLMRLLQLLMLLLLLLMLVLLLLMLLLLLLMLLLV